MERRGHLMASCLLLFLHNILEAHSYMIPYDCPTFVVDLHLSFSVQVKMASLKKAQVAELKAQAGVLAKEEIKKAKGA